MQIFTCFTTYLISLLYGILFKCLEPLKTRILKRRQFLGPFLLSLILMKMAALKD
jgi:hypothetical protein